METNLTISIIDECLKNTDSECEDILKTKEALSILKQGKYEINELGGVHGCGHPLNEAVTQRWQKPDSCEELVNFLLVSPKPI